MHTKFGLAAVLLAVLSLGVSGQRTGGNGGGGRGGGNDDEAGCCYGADKCADASETSCARMASRGLGCEWRSGEDADCTFVAEPGCCFSETGNSRCDVDDQTTCEKNARRGGCEWRVGDAEDLCATMPPEPGCCAPTDPDHRNAAKCLDFDSESDCVDKPRLGCEWRSGSDAICDPTSSNPEEGLTVVCDVSMEDDNSCSGTEIDCPNTGACSVACTASGACYQTTINCPGDYPCDISCTAEGFSCFDAVFNWAATPGLGSLECLGQSSCGGIDFPDPDPTTPLDIVCSEENTCSQSTIRCPASAACSVTCSGSHSCDKATLLCPDSDACQVSCVDDGACFDMAVEWSSAVDRNALVCSGVNACHGVTLPTSSEEQMAFEEMNSPVATQPASLVNESLMLLAGVCAVLMTLATAFYVYGRKDKVAAAWDEEE